MINLWPAATHAISACLNAGDTDVLMSQTCASTTVSTPRAGARRAGRADAGMTCEIFARFTTPSSDSARPSSSFSSLRRSRSRFAM